MQSYTNERNTNTQMERGIKPEEDDFANLKL